MKTLLLAISCLTCGVVLGFVLNSLLFFSDVSWLGKGAQPTLVDSNLGTPFNSTLANPPPQPIRLESKEVAISEPARQAPQSSDTFAIAGLSYDVLSTFSPESSISDQQQLLALIANADLAQITQAFNDIPNDNSRIHEQQWVIGLLAQRRVELDPQGVLLDIEDALLNTKGRYGNDMAKYVLAKNYARQHPQDLLTWLSDLPENSVSPDALMNMYLNLAEVVPESAIEMIIQNSSLSSSISGGAESILYMWSDKDPAAALRWLKGQDDEQLINQHAESMISMLLHRDPDAARAIAVEFPGLVPESLFVIQEVTTLAESDPLAAFALAQSMPDGEQALSAKQGVLYTWSMIDPVAAIDFINTLPESNERLMFANMIAGSIGLGTTGSVQQRDELLAWSETLSPDLKMQVQQPLIMQWVDQQPQAALNWWHTQPESAEKSSLLQSIAWGIPAQDAMDLYPVVDESAQVALSSTIIRHLYESDPAAAQNWYDQLPNNVVKQRSMHDLFMMKAHENPQEALSLIDDALANGVFDDDATMELAFGLLPMLVYENGGIVENWLQGADLDSEVKARVNEMLTGSRSEMNSFPMSGPFGSYPPVMPAAAQYRVEYMND